MELLGFLFVCWIIWNVVRAIKNAVTPTPPVADFEFQVVDDYLGPDRLPIWAVQIKGPMPLFRATRLGVAVSVLDVTNPKEPMPILGAIEDFHEPGGYAFFFGQDLGIFEPYHGFINWSNVGLVPKDLLMYPIAGQRKIRIMFRVVNMDNPPPIQHGFTNEGHPGLILKRQHTMTVNVERGFAEKSEEELGVAAASIRLAVRLALADGKFVREEGLAIRDWAKIYIDSVATESGRAKAKEFLNEAIKYAVKDGMENISISDQIDHINRVAGKPEKYAAMELCLDVMAADGVADKQEMDMLNRLCESLGLSMESFKEMKEKRTISLEHANFSSDDLWGRLDIDSGLPNQEKKRHLNSLYRKWNSRAESLEDGDEREKAQEMLDLIAQARHQLG